METLSQGQCSAEAKSLHPQSCQDRPYSPSLAQLAGYGRCAELTDVSGSMLTLLKVYVCLFFDAGPTEAQSWWKLARELGSRNTPPPVGLVHRLLSELSHRYCHYIGTTLNANTGVAEGSAASLVSPCRYVQIGAPPAGGNMKTLCRRPGGQR